MSSNHAEPMANEERFEPKLALGIVAPTSVSVRHGDSVIEIFLYVGYLVAKHGARSK